MIALHTFSPNAPCWIRHCINIVTQAFISDNIYTDNLKPQINGLTSIWQQIFIDRSPGYFALQ